jgi:hypothetical protein
MNKTHTFHIPVMGTGYTADTPLKVSHYGIDSVISVVDDILLEKLRKMYCEKFEVPYHEISNKIDDFRAKRISSYLNLINSQAEKKFEDLKNATMEKSQGIKDYFSMLPESSVIKQEFTSFKEKLPHLSEIKSWLKDNLSMGSIDVNIMTKVDKENFNKDGKLPVEYNDAHAALRGFANSDLKSSVVLSAGMNPRLYSYIENFDDFFPNENGEIAKKIVLKVSDYRSALIQGKFFAKKGLWVSEYRIESGLNCGGHAFATDGFLMGPILEEFSKNRETLANSVNEILVKALATKNRTVPTNELALKITAQGGVGTNEEHQFLMDHYNIDSVGWGSPFLLVPEATNVDENTLNQLIEAEEKDLFLSGISPLGVPFNSLRNSSMDVKKFQLAENGKPGSPCPKKLLQSNKEFTERAICTASVRYQKLKIKELESLNLSAEEHKSKYEKIIEKACLCIGLGTTSLIVNGIETENYGEAVSICPGPNIAYFTKKLSLKEMVDHIYGRTNVISRDDRPNMFVKELSMYLDYLKDRIDETKADMSAKQEKYLTTFAKNLHEGIDYYNNLFVDLKDKFEDTKINILSEFSDQKNILKSLSLQIESLSGKTIAIPTPIIINTQS